MVEPMFVIIKSEMVWRKVFQTRAMAGKALG